MSPLIQATEFFQQGKLQEASDIYTRLIRADARNGQAYWGLGNIALKIEQFDRATSFLETACTLLPSEPNPLVALSKAYNGNGRHSLALQMLERAVELTPHLPDVLYENAQQKLKMGDLKKAEAAFRRVIAVGPSAQLSYGYLEIARLKKFDHEDEDFAKIESLLIAETTKSHDQMVLSYAMGKALNDLGRYNEAFEYFSTANQIQLTQCTFKTRDLISFFTQVQSSNASLMPENLADAELTNPCPIFIVGLPRTGSTLLEQMLTAHGDISAGGELPYIGREVAGFLQRSTGKHYPMSAEYASSEIIAGARDVYLSKVRQIAGTASFVTDKLPANFQSIGLIHKLFPKAKIINISRSRPAVAFSIFRNFFQENEPYFCSMEEFKIYADEFDKLMAFWRAKLPGVMLNLSYENLITDSEAEIRRILNYCKLDWDARCLRPENNKGLINTLSAVQVRNPVNYHKDDAWRHYSEFLTPFL